MFVAVSYFLDYRINFVCIYVQTKANIIYLLLFVGTSAFSYVLLGEHPTRVRHIHYFMRH